MKRIVVLVVGMLLLTFAVKAQLVTCDVATPLGQNLITNGGFEDGDVGFSVPTYRSWNQANPLPGFSSPGDYYVTDDADKFNVGAFSGLPHTGNALLAVDGLCDPGSIVWEQNINITKDTRYFFSVWIASIHPASPAELSFEIDGVLLPEAIIAPSVTGQWIQFVDSSWFSGNIEGNVTIRIRNAQTVGCANGNDFALDDIEITPGCFFGEPGLRPDLGERIQTICGTANGTLTIDPILTPGPTYEFRWSTGDSTKALDITQPGIYALCMTTNGSCPQSDIVIIQDDFSVDLGPDLDLCSPAIANISADYLLGSQYLWSKKNSGTGVWDRLGDKSGTSIIVNEPGDYRVEVLDPACPSQSDSLTVTSSTAQAENATFCPGDNLPVNLAISNTSGDPNNYKWYSDASLTTLVDSGVTYTTPSNLTQTTTYWVKDESQFSFTFGPSSSGNFFGNGFGGNSPDNYIVFDVHTDVFLDTVSLYLAWAGWGASQNISVRIQDWTGGTFNGDVIIASETFAPACADASCNCACPLVGDTKREMPLGVMLEAGKTYRIANIGAGQIWTFDGSNIDLSQFNTNSQFLDITALESNGQPSNQLVGFFDWKIRGGSPCDPVQVQAVFDPILCSNCDLTDVSISSNGGTQLACPSDQVTLTATVIGTGTWQYAWEKDGQPIGTNSSTLVATGEGIYTVDVTDLNEPLICFGQSNSISITVGNVAPITTTIDPALSIAQCLPGTDISVSATSDGTNPVYQWFVNDIEAVTSPGNPINVPLLDGDELKVVVTGDDACGTSQVVADSIIMIGQQVLMPSVTITGGETPTCLLNTVNFTAIPTDATAPSYVWMINSGPAPSDNTLNPIDLTLTDGDTVKVQMIADDACGVSHTVLSNETVVVGLSEIVPTVSLSGLSSGICQGDEAVVVATTNITDPSAVITYEWTINAGAPILGTDTLKATLLDGDNVTVLITVSGVSCLAQTTATTSDVASVISSVTPSVAISTLNNGVCDTELPMNFVVGATSGEGNTPSYEWFINGITTSQTGPSFSSSALSDGDLVTVELTSSLACVDVNPVVSNQEVVSIISTEIITVSLSADKSSSCATELITFTAIPSNPLGSYQWQVNGLDVGTDVDTYSTSSLSNGDQVSVIFTSTIQCPDLPSTSDVTTVTVQTPTVSIDNIFSGTWCTGKDNGFEVVSTSLAGTSPSYTWEIDGVPNAETSSQLISQSFVQGQVVKVTMTPSAPNDVCPSVSDSATVGVFQNADTVKLFVSDQTVCDGNLVTISSSSLFGGLTPKFQWEVNGVADVADTNSSLSLTNVVSGTKVKLRMESSEYCVVDTIVSDSAIITVVQTPDAIIAHDGSGVLQLSEFAEITLDGTGSTAGVNYLWSSKKGDLSIQDSLTNLAKVTPVDKETRMYLMASESANGRTCFDIDSLLVIVDFDFRVDNAFSPNGDGANDLFVIDNLALLDEFTLEIYNRWGSLLYTQTDPDAYWDGTNNGKQLPVATYYYILEYVKDGEDLVKKGFISLIK